LFLEIYKNQSLQEEISQRGPHKNLSLKGEIGDRQQNEPKKKGKKEKKDCKC
jgi:hypothetical protein